MRTLLLAAAMLIAGPAVAYDDEKIDDYTACLIGQTVMALNAQGDKKDIEAAYSAFGDKKCPPPEGFNDNTFEAENLRESDTPRSCGGPTMLGLITLSWAALTRPDGLVALAS